MPYFPNPAGGSMYAANEQQAASQGWTPSMGSFGVYSQNEMGTPPSSGGGGGGGGTVAPTVAGAGGQQLASGINSLLGAIASGNKQAFDEAVRQFNATFGLDQNKFTEAVRQFNETLGITQAGLTGTYQGSPTQQAQMQAANIAAQQAGLTGYYNAPGILGGALGAAGGMPTAADFAKQSAQEQQTWTGTYGANAPQAWAQAATQRVQQFQAQNPGATSWTLGGATGALAQPAQGGLQGTPTLQAQRQWAELYGGNAAPGAGQETLAAQQQRYAQQMGMIAQAATLQANPFRQQQAMGQMGRLLGGQGVAGFQAPNTVAGVGVAGGNTQGGMGYLQQMVDDIRDPTANTQSMNQILQGIPTPNKVNSVEFLRAAPSTQNMVLQGMQEKYGLDPADALGQIKNTLPGFQAPTAFGGIKR